MSFLRPLVSCIRLLLVVGVLTGLGDAIIHATTHDCSDHPCQSCHLASSAALPTVPSGVESYDDSATAFAAESVVSFTSHFSGPTDGRAPPIAHFS